MVCEAGVASPAMHVHTHTHMHNAQCAHRAHHRVPRAGGDVLDCLAAQLGRAQQSGCGVEVAEEQVEALLDGEGERRLGGMEAG